MKILIAGIVIAVPLLISIGFSIIAVLNLIQYVNAKCEHNQDWIDPRNDRAF